MAATAPDALSPQISIQSEKKEKWDQGPFSLYSVVLLPKWQYFPPTPGSLLFMTCWSELGGVAIPAPKRGYWASTRPTGNCFIMRNSDQAQRIPRPGTISCGINWESVGKNRGVAIEPSTASITAVSLERSRHWKERANFAYIIARQNFSSLGFHGYSRVPQTHLGSSQGWIKSKYSLARTCLVHDIHILDSNKCLRNEGGEKQTLCLLAFPNIRGQIQQEDWKGSSSPMQETLEEP